jgi:hypothetical protein
MTPTTLDAFEEAGLAALVRAGEAKQWFAGHFGAALISGTRLLREPDLPGRAAMALSERLSRLMAAQREWFAPLPFAAGAPAPVEPLHVALRRHAATLRTSGHSTIYLATALALLERRPEWRRERVVEALAQLHAAGLDDDPARYYGVDDYFALLARDPDEACDPHIDCDAGDARRGSGGDASTGGGGARAALRRALAALDHLVADRTIDGRRYFLTGEKIHLLTLAHAIGLFERLGLADVAQAAGRAHADLARLVAPSRALEPTPVGPARCTPFDEVFWEQDAFDDLHVVKLAEAVVALWPGLSDQEGAVARERVGRLWSLLGLR